MAFARKSKPAAAAPAPGPSAAEQYAAALDRCVDLRAKLDANVREELAWTGARPDAEVVQLLSARRQAAEVLARTGQRPAKGEATPRTFADIISDRRDLELAIEISNEQCEQARLAAAGERYAARINDVAAAGRKIALCVIALDEAQRERDAMAREIGLPAGSLWLEAWPFGRIAHTASIPYRFLEQAVANGALKQRELDEAVNAARAANQ